MLPFKTRLFSQSSNKNENMPKKSNKVATAAAAEEEDKAAVADKEEKKGTTEATEKTKDADKAATTTKKTADKDKESKADDGKKVEDETPEEDDPNAIQEPADPDVLSGRGASVNAHQGNKKFRSLCFARKPEFEAGNHAAKRRIATEIVNVIYEDGKARFLKKKGAKGPWFEMTKEQAILKACQVMRDHKRPDRVAMRAAMEQNGSARKRNRSQEPSTPLLDTPVPSGPLDPIIENPFGVHDHDILSGRGAFVNGHVGNQRLRKLALERKANFDAGNYTEKRTLASEIVSIIRQLDPPGRFLKRGKPTEEKAKDGEEAKDADKGGLGDEWIELSDEKAIHKACQVMRDIDRPDRKDREARRAKKKQKKSDDSEGEKKDSAMDVLAKTTAAKAAVEEAVAATEEALDKALDAADAKQTAEI